MKQPSISIIAPLYNEEESLPFLIERLNRIIEKAEFLIEIILIDDGSIDKTCEIITHIGLTNDYYKSIILSRNFGHQIAVTAGIANASCTEGALIIDGDLQDPPELLFDFYDKYKEGFDVIYAIRKKRKENFAKKLLYSGFHRLLKAISVIDIPIDSGDFSFISRRVIDSLNNMPEESRFIRGMRSWIGYNQIGIEYERDSRVAGESKYTLLKLIKLAKDGIFNFSEFPIKFINFIGILSIFCAVLYFLVTIYKKIFLNIVPTGFTAIVFLIIFFSGIQLLSINLIGQYIIKIFFQVKNRPLYLIKSIVYKKN